LKAEEKVNREKEEEEELRKVVNETMSVVDR